MAEILSDSQIKLIIGKVIINTDESLINPNSIDLRVGKHVYFHSTEEELELQEGFFLKICPGETVSFSSFEEVDFRQSIVDQFFPNESLLGLLTPTTTMMREGISQVTTKIDVGYKGVLNWSLRSGSSKDIFLRYKEPIFKLTIFKLKGNEVPSISYGQKNEDVYQGTTGINHSRRQLPANIPKNKTIQSNYSNIDPKKQLKEAGYPFSFIGTELTELQGKFQVVSNDVMLIKDEFSKKTDALASKIDKETSDLANKIDKETQQLKDQISKTETNILDKFSLLFNEQFAKIVGVLISATAILYGGVTYLQTQKFNANVISFVSIIIGIASLLVMWILTRRTKA